MADLKKISQFLDKELDINSIDDNSHNGLQVESDKPIKKIGFAVDACMDTFKKAKKEGCDMVIVHHGLFWNKKETITGMIYKRVKFLIENNIALYGVHLPLDKHKKYGNNVLLFKILGVVPKEEFGSVGYIGMFKSPKPLKSIIKILNTKLDAKCKILGYGPKNIKKIAICSGGAQYKAGEAIDKGADLFITGEIGHSNYHQSTETIGVKALMPLLAKKFQVKTVFLDSPTGL